MYLEKLQAVRNFFHAGVSYRVEEENEQGRAVTQEQITVAPLSLLLIVSNKMIVCETGLNKGKVVIATNRRNSI